MNEAAYGFAVYWRRPDPVGRYGDKQAHNVQFMGLVDSKLQGNPELRWMTESPTEEAKERVVLVATNLETLDDALLDRWRAALRFEDYEEKLSAGLTLGDWHRQQQAKQRMLRPFAKPKELRRVERMRKELLRATQSH